MIGTVMSQKVLLVDDDPGVVAAVTKALLDEACDLLVVFSAAEALAILEREHVRIVVADETVDDMSGMDFLRLVSRDFSDTVRILLTGQDHLEQAKQGLNQGQLFRFFVKPFRDEDLAATIRQALSPAGGRPLDARRLQVKKAMEAVLLQDLETKHPGITRVDTDEEGAIVIDDLEEAEKVLDSFIIADEDG